MPPCIQRNKQLIEESRGTPLDGKQPVLPSFVPDLVRTVPTRFKSQIITRALNELFETAILDGDLDFLHGHSTNITVEDTGLEFSVTLVNNRLIAGNALPVSNVSIAGTVHTFLLLATRSEDPDTLFFNRRLKTEGDTDLGLYLKNFLAALDPDSLPYHKLIDLVLRNTLTIAERYQTLLDARKALFRRQ